MGLDPLTVTTLSPLLHSLAQASSPRLILALRPQDPVPCWISHVIRLGNNLQILFHGKKDLLRPETEQGQGKKRVLISMSLTLHGSIGIVLLI